MKSIGSWVASGRHGAQPAKVVSPTLGMAGALLDIGQTSVRQTQERSIRLFDQIDLHQAGARRHHLATIPAEAVSQTMNRNHFAKRAASETCTSDVDEVEPSRLRLDLRLCSHPAEDLFRIRQQGEHCSRR